MKEYKKILTDRYNRSNLDKLDKLLLDDMCSIPSENGFEAEVLDWLESHPNASLQDFAEYVDTFLEPLEIVDDDEED